MVGQRQFRGVYGRFRNPAHGRVGEAIQQQMCDEPQMQIDRLPTSLIKTDEELQRSGRSPNQISHRQVYQQHEDCEGNTDTQPSPREKKARAFPIIGRRHEISGKQKHQSHAKRRICGIERSKPTALRAIMHGPKATGGPVGLGGVVDNDESDGRNTQRVDEDQPLLGIIV
jgi:hypothetical protein